VRLLAAPGVIIIFDSSEVCYTYAIIKASYMKRIVYHILIPAIMPAVFFVIASTPVEVLECRTRGLIALLLSLFSGLGALGAAIIGVKGRIRGDVYSVWWVASSLILSIPVVALIILA
jgi:hypothetical protein